MNVEKYIKEKITTTAITDGIGKVYIAPEIPDKKMNNALKDIAPGERPEHVLVLIDTSLLGSGKAGLVFVGDKVYINNSFTKMTIAYQDVSTVNVDTKIVFDNKGRQKSIEQVELEKKDGTKTDLTPALDFINKKSFAELINGIILEAGETEGEFEKSNQTCPLAMMDNSVKETYLKIICNYAFSDDDIIDAEEYAAIMSLIAMNDFEKESRMKIREYMTNNERLFPTESLINILLSEVDAGSGDKIKLSLMKDMLHLLWEKTKAGNWKDNKTIIECQHLLSIDDAQIDYIMDSIIKNEDIIANRQSDMQIKKTMQGLLSASASVGVPLAAVYLSGSVLGVSAAGMTSGLAALGMGGVLGFSSMFTGIGVAVLLGVGAYKGVKKVTGIGELEQNRQREMMLQQVVKNSQKALNFIVEDFNDLSLQLQKALAGNEIDKAKIKKLSMMLVKISESAKKTSSQADFAEKEKLICHMPVSISPAKIEELAPGATKQNIREFIYSCYSETKTTETGEVISHYINWEMPLETVEKLDSIFEEIGYYKIIDNSIASAVGVAKSFLKKN